MPFEKVEKQVNFPAQERDVLAFWEKEAIFEKLRARNQGGPTWSFLDGPITANNPMGVHHAWGRTYKDAYNRYHAMLGHELRYQNGFDCQGLWVEVEVEKALDLKSKRDIENLVEGDTFASIDKFVTLCKERVNKFAKVQTEQSIRLGYWMDWDREEDWQKPPGQRRSYFTMSEENNYTIWSFLKKCYDRELVYKAYDAMPWCPRCSVGLSQMEMSEGYRLVADRAVFVRFPLRERTGENLLVWTTTPWTLSSNVGAAVNPELTYLKVQHHDEIYYVAKGAMTAKRLEEDFKAKRWVPGVPKLKTLEQIFKEKGGFEIVGEVKGAEMIGWTYDGPFDELEAQQQPFGHPADIAAVVEKQKWAPKKSAKELHQVIAWPDVGENEGTGIVHIAPGCGKADFELGKQYGLPPIAPLDEFGVFLDKFGFLTGKPVGEATTDAILDNLKEKGLFLAVEKYPHSYPHCWRCKQALLFRLVDEWFINMEWRQEIKDVVEQVTFLPESINGKARELDWLDNMGDWMISKKRFWGLALPIWVCESCDHFDVIGNRDELQQRAIEGWDKFEGHPPHRPWIDLVKIDCSKCGGTSSRIGDVGNPWLDAGIVPYSTMKYNTDRDYWNKWFPADFITESFPGQFRNWFYAILTMSTMMENKPPFKVLLGHGLVRDQLGAEMHKADGNSIPFEGAADGGYQIKNKQGEWEEHPPISADLVRWMYARHNPATNINFGPIPANELRARFFLKLWHSYAMFCEYAKLDKFDPLAEQVPLAQRPDIDRWILSDLQLLIAKARKAFESYNVMAFCLEAEKFVDDKLSNWYIRRNRRRFWKSDKGQDKQAAYQTLYTVLVTLSKLFAPVVPFLSEVMYRNLRPNVDFSDEWPKSVHLCTFPEVDASLIDEELTNDMNALLEIISMGSAARNSVKIKVRQPLAEVRIQPGEESDVRVIERFVDQIREELNIKKVTLHEASPSPLLAVEVQPNMKNLGPKFGPKLKQVRAALSTADAATIVLSVEAGKSFQLEGDGGPFELAPEDVLVERKAAEGWAGVVEKGRQVAVDTRITEELAREGHARDIIRQVQDLRKQADLDIEDRICVYLATESDELTQAIDAHRDYIAQETLTTQWVNEPLDGEAHHSDVTINKQSLRISLEKAK